jgi:hypothetical protein
MKMNKFEDNKSISKAKRIASILRECENARFKDFTLKTASQYIG